MAYGDDGIIWSEIRANFAQISREILTDAAPLKLCLGKMSDRIIALRTVFIDTRSH
jgi:hypothetical protein